MSDQGRWFKLHANSLLDQALEELTLEDYARWVRTGLYLKVHGTGGTVSLKRPGVVLQRVLRIDGYENLLSTMRRFPNCEVTTNETIITVTFRNWHKYQGDMSTDRVRQFRIRETGGNTKVKRAKNRTEQNRIEQIPPISPNGFDRFWSAYPRKTGRGVCEDWWKKARPGTPLIETMLRSIASAKRSDQWQRNDGQYIPLPLTWLNQRRWGDNPHPETEHGKSAKVRELERSVLDE